MFPDHQKSQNVDIVLHLFSKNCSRHRPIRHSQNLKLLRRMKMCSTSEDILLLWTQLWGRSQATGSFRYSEGTHPSSCGCLESAKLVPQMVPPLSPRTDALTISSYSNRRHTRRHPLQQVLLSVRHLACNDFISSADLRCCVLWGGTVCILCELLKWIPNNFFLLHMKVYCLLNCSIRLYCAPIKYGW